ncbi:hypothetical protein MXD62_32675 [Frankia sp. Mgl5]|uniref:hypothetical protein n=1 Tax=Frankia sp. Mgl5 TaxID=2933793 RepID=UPI00200F2571|nr:hypothetical protein [Frankia sp. Mgl5]MCK9931838.1 hypothetical protein [Frankia sp. Mgl5]
MAAYIASSLPGDRLGAGEVDVPQQYRELVAVDPREQVGGMHSTERSRALTVASTRSP